MIKLILECWAALVYFEAIMCFRPFHVVHRIVEDAPCRVVADEVHCSTETICHAMDVACVLHLKQVLCLQRSAAVTFVLRRHGWSAEMVIGVQLLPFRSHAWVEVGRAVVNDRSYVPSLYQALKRC